MNEEIRLTKAIHYFVRGQLSSKESLELLVEVLESEKWLKYLETEIMFYEMTLMGSKVIPEYN